ncbi:MAG: hypothetical protein HC846_12865 [Blastocatellia bacterium]|nr:hypothetical protein [Blastocatellia bacterium]
MEKTIISFEKFLLNSQTRQLHRQNEIVEISSKGFDVLFYLIQKRGELATKDEIYQAVWGDTFVEENNIHVQISALRRVLGEKRGESKFIKTVPGKGYIFIAPVEKLAHNKVAKSTSNSYSLNNYQDSVTSIAVLPFSFEQPDDEFDYLTNGITQNLIEQLSGVPGLR